MNSDRCVIEISANGWTSVLDFYQAIFSVIGAPSWHGASIGALVDSMIWGGINDRKPPYKIRVRDLDVASASIRQEMMHLQESLCAAREEFMKNHGVFPDVYFEIY